MNKPRRKSLQTLLDRLADIHDTLEEIKGEEEDYRDNMPENLQGSERYEKANEACDNLYEAVSNLEEAISNIETAIE